MASKSKTKKKAARGAGSKASSSGGKASTSAARSAKPRAKAKKTSKKTAPKKSVRKTAKKTASAKKSTAVKKSSSSRKVSAAAMRPASRAKASAVVAQPTNGVGVVARNPLTHRGTRPSRTQLLLEHQGAPVEPVVSAAPNGSGVGPQGSNLGELVRSTEVRNLSLRVQSENSQGKRVENLLSGTANARIGGHASGAGRRAQGRRDAAQRGEKRPGAAD